MNGLVAGHNLSSSALFPFLLLRKVVTELAEVRSGNVPQLTRLSVAEPVEASRRSTEYR
jgi:hypothetical protein